MRRGRAPPTNLPVVRDPLIGRARELRVAKDLLLREEIGLLTLTGAGGTGKTRLALQLAADVLEHFDDGVYFIGLATLRTSDVVASNIARTLGLWDGGSQPAEDVVAEFLRGRCTLLILDNFEHLLDAATMVGAWLAGAPRLKVLATSRSPLHLHGEHELPVPPLALPGPGRPLRVEELLQYGAVALFERRAIAVQPDFALFNGNAMAVVEICRRLDGLPLAIELAAARLKLFSPEALLGRLDRRLVLLTGGARDVPARQRTLRETIAWSYDLLSSAEQRLFCRLAVFAGGWTLEAAITVCDAQGDLGIDVVDGIASLADKSLVLRDDLPGEPRFHLLETIREYAVERLEPISGAAATRRRHAEHYLALAEDAAPKLRGAEQAVWFTRLEQDHDNLRAALTWSVIAGNAPSFGLRLAAALYRFWWRHGHLSEGRAWLARAVDLDAGRGTGDDAGVRRARAMALNGAGVLARAQADYAAAGAFFEESLAIFRELGDGWSIANALHNLATVRECRGDFAAARPYNAESLAIWREVDDPWGIANALDLLAIVQRGLGDYAEATAHFAESLALKQQLGDAGGISFSLRCLGMVAGDQGDYARATALLQESLARFRELGDKAYIASALHSLGRVAVGRGDCGRAVELFTEGLVLGKELGSPRDITEGLQGLATVAAAQQQHAQVAQLSGAADALSRRDGSASAFRSPAARAMYETAVAAARARLGEAVFAAAQAAGQIMPLEQVIADALAGLDATRRPVVGPELPLPARELSRLTRREQEVAARIARGLTNRQIAAELVITEGTVGVHVEHILGKLGCRSRVQVAAWAVEYGLLPPRAD